MNAIKTLSRNEMKNIMAGGCRIFIRNDDGSNGGYSPGCFDPQTAQGIYNGTTPSFAEQGTYVSGYCCASCGSGGFSNADPC